MCLYWLGVVHRAYTTSEKKIMNINKVLNRQCFEICCLYMQYFTPNIIPLSVCLFLRNQNDTNVTPFGAPSSVEFMKFGKYCT